MFLTKMRKNLLAILVLFLGTTAKAQNGFSFSCTRDTVISCTQSCINLRGFIPNIHALSDDYDVSASSDGFCTVQIPSSSVQGTPTNINLDDRYTQIIPMPFDFPFYGIYYSQLVASSNGIISFDETNANGFSHYGILSNGFGLSAFSGTPVDLPSTEYDRAIIMGPYHDIDIAYNTSPNKKIYYQVDGVAPYRRWILGFYEIPLYYTADNCDLLIKNTHQIILNESTGIIDVFIYDKQICTGWNEGRAMVGLQNYDQDKGIMAPGRAASSPPWGSIGMNESWRFTPKSGASLFQRVELYDLGGNLIATGDTTSFTNSVLGVNFPSICPTASSTTYVIKSTYLKVDDPSVEVYGYDTVNVIKNTAIPPVTADTTKATCGGNGSITVTAPLGASYEYSLDGTTYQSSPVFSVPAGHYTIYVREVSGVCVNTKDVDVTSVSALIASAVATNTSCPGVSNGSIAVHVSQGAPGFTFLIDAMTVGQTDSLFTGLAEGTHVVTVKDNAGCSYVFNVDVFSDVAFTTTASSINASCLGVANGSITVTQPSSGATPFQYSIPGVINTPQASPTLINLAGGTSYTVKVQDANGCSYSFSQQVNNNPGVSATDSIVAAECSLAPNGKLFVKPGTGVAPFSFAKDGGVAQPADSFLNLLPATYLIKVTDAVGCYYEFNSTVTAGAGFTATDSTVISACTGATTGKIYVKAVGGIGPFTYSKDGGAPQSANFFLNLAPATYVIRVTDAVGCFYEFNSTVGAGTGISATDSTVVSACTGATTGKIFIRPVGGVAPFSFTKNGGAPQPADSFINLAPAIYLIRVTDAVGCYYEFNSTVGAGTGVTATDSTVLSNCTTASTGKIFIKTGIGTAPFTYSLNGGVTQLVDSFINLAPATYLIRVTDAAGCYYDFNATVGAGPGITATDSTVVANCATATTGKIFVRPTGVAPFTFSKDGGTPQAADSFINLIPATYVIKVTDALGCSYTFNSTVGVGAGVTATDSTVVSNCAVATTGKIFVKTGLGVAPFSYSKDGGIAQPGNSFTNLAPATYAIKVTDAVGCSYTFNSTVGIGAGVTATDSTVVSNCATATTGKIFVKTGLGVAPFTYSKDGGLPQSGNSFVNLSPGTYAIKVTDAVGCSYTFNSTVGVGAGVTATDSTVVSNCTTATTGKIFVKTGLGVAPFTYSKDGGLPQLGNSFVNLAPGTYAIKVTDAVGCSYTFNSTVGAGVGVTGSFIPQNSACLGVSSGQITVITATGVSPFDYTIDSYATTQNSNIFKNLASGTYTIGVRDAVGCELISAPQNVDNNPGVTASFTIIKSACAGAATGAIIVKPNSGTPVFRYSLDAGATYQYDSVFRNLAANAYNIRIRDTSGCILNSPVQNLTNNPGVLTSPSTIQNASCAVVPNGSITVNVTAGIAPFTYSLLGGIPPSPPQAGNNYGSLFSGSYTIKIVDSAGCAKTITEVVGNNPKVKIDSLNIVRPSCNGLTNGIINVHASLGVGPYQYAIDAGTFTGSKTLTGIAAGPHVIHIRDANSCQIDSAIVITEPATLANNLVSKTSSTCSGTADGQIVVNATGGTLPYQYSLDVAGLIGYQSSATFPVIAGNYTVTVQDANACKASVNVLVDSVFTMFLDLGNDTTICAEQSVTLSPNTNAGTTVFSYTPQASLDKPTDKNPVATPTATTQYRLTAKWGICTLTDSITVNVLRKPVANAGADVVICYDTTTVLHASASNLSGTVNYLWSQASLIEGRADTTDITARPDTFKTYYTVTVTDNYGCNFAVTDSVLVNMLPPVYAFAGNDTNAVLNAPHQLKASGAGVGGTYTWTYPAGVILSANGIANPYATFSPTQPGTFHPDTNYYKLSVIATNQAGCWATDTVKINVFVGPTFYVPNAFSPNGDGFNDVFRPILVGMYSTDYFIVYNRYGQIVFETNRFMQGWDGKFKGIDQPSGNYVWTLKGKGQGGRPVEMKGSVLLVR
jgi:gliding motility-associated-like protein